MRTTSRISLISVALLLVPTLPADETEVGTVTGEVVGFGSGDSLRLISNGKSLNVRLAGIDAPELGQYYGVNSRRQLRSQLLGKTVTVKPIKPSSDGVVVGEVFVGSGRTARSMNLWMIENGWAWHDKEFEPARYAAAEANARKNGQGLWQHPSPLSPWDWRQLCETAGRQVIAKYEVIAEDSDDGGFKRKIIKIRITAETTESALRATMLHIVARSTAENPELDAVAVLAYRQGELNYENNIGRLVWCPKGDWAATSAEIAKDNNRSTYKYVFLDDLASKAKQAIPQVAVDRKSNSPPDRNVKRIKQSAEQVFVTTSRQVHRRLMDFLVANDMTGAKQLFQSGQVFVVPGGTKVRVIKFGRLLDVTEIRILEGSHKDRLGFTISEHIEF